MNKLIEELITEQKYEEALSSIDAYESFQIGDSDIYTYRFLYYLGIGNNGLALQYAKKAVKEQPYVADVHYNCAYAYEINNHLYEAYEQYIIAYQIISYGNKSDITLDEAFADVQRVLELVLDSVKNKSLDKHKLDYIAGNNKYFRCYQLDTEYRYAYAVYKLRWNIAGSYDGFYGTVIEYIERL